MNLLEAIVNYAQAHLTPNNDWYAWKKINASYFPQGIVVPPGNQYTQNVTLKQSLSALYAAGDEDRRFELTRYYIVNWGGVRGNKVEKLRTYALAQPAELIANGSKGIASWSKALCVRNPNIYAIYDARVALALNCLQEAYQVETPKLFPLITGQNKAVNSGVAKMREHAQDNQWETIPEQDFYCLYNENLSRAAKMMGIEIYTLEMLLFSKVLDLYAVAFPEPD